jgi:7TM-HD extracellular
MISVQSPDARLDLDAVAKQAAPFFRTNIFQLWRVRKELQNSFPPEEQAVGKFLSGFLKPNCVFEEELTRQSRARRTEPIWAADQYEPGQLIVEQGQVVTARIKAALDELEARTIADHIKAQAVESQLQAQATVSHLREQATLAESAAGKFRQRNQWLLAGLVLCAVIFALALWRGFRMQRAPSMLPARLDHEPASRASQDSAVVSCPNCAEAIVIQGANSEAVLPWQQRALIAEQRAQQATAMMRKSLLPHLARWLRTKIVRGLITQRAQLLNAQQAAELELAKLEKRLASINAPLEERLKAYELRIAELENELAAKARENQELIRIQIALTRKKLERERLNRPLAWN